MSNRRYDVIVMGAGITGSSIAYHLVKKGWNNILVLDKDCAGCGQTSMSSALIRLHYTDPIIREMAVYSWKFWKDRFRDEVECDEQVFIKTGVGFAGLDEHYESMREVVDDLKRLGVDAELYDPETFKSTIYKDVAVEDVGYVAWEPDSGHGDPNTSVNCFIRYVIKNGGIVKEREEIKRLISRNGYIEGVITDKGVYYAEYIVNALGVWTNNVLSTVGVKLPIKIGMEQVLVIEHNRKIFPPGWGDLVLGFYSRPDGKNRQLIGGLDVEYPDIPPVPGPYSTPPPNLVLKRMEPYSKRFPGMRGSRPVSAWRGFYDITPDWQPIIGFDNKYVNLIHMVGLSGHGFKLAPAYGEVISDIIIYGRSRIFDVTKFNINRFRENISRHSKYKFGIIG